MGGIPFCLEGSARQPQFSQRKLRHLLRGPAADISLQDLASDIRCLRSGTKSKRGAPPMRPGEGILVSPCFSQAKAKSVENPKTVHETCVQDIFFQICVDVAMLPPKKRNNHLQYPFAPAPKSRLQRLPGFVQLSTPGLVEQCSVNDRVLDPSSAQGSEALTVRSEKGREALRDCRLPMTCKKHVQFCRTISSMKRSRAGTSNKQHWPFFELHVLKPGIVIGPWTKVDSEHL